LSTKSKLQHNNGMTLQTHGKWGYFLDEIKAAKCYCSTDVTLYCESKVPDV